MSEKRVKTTSKLMVFEEEKVDRISKLHDEILIHILSFLPTEDLLPTSLISKRWRFLWCSVPSLNFLQTKKIGHLDGQEMFYNFVNNFLENRKRGMDNNDHHDSVITSFKLYIDQYDWDNAHASHHIDRWLGLVVENKVKEIHLVLWEEKYDRENGIMYYTSLPKPLLNAKYLTILNLVRVDLDCSYTFSFPYLKSLKLGVVRFAEKDVLDNLLLGSPSLERLELSNLSSDHKLHIHSDSLALKFLEVVVSDNIVVESIEVVNLESMRLVGVPFEKINLMVCKRIRTLWLGCDFNMNELSSLEYLISNLPLLEDLTLSNDQCLGLKRIKISSESLKSFSVENSGENTEMNVVVESAPKLESFRYKGKHKFSITMESSNSLNGTFIILAWPWEKFDGDWFINLLNLLLNLNCCWNKVTLHVDTLKALIFPKNLRRACRSSLLNWKHLTVFATRLERESELRDALLWMSPSLKTLSILKRSSLACYCYPRL
ncbi:hypothetical protein CsatB_018472 [Cannabis sativa]